jgi:actin-related protein 2
MSDKGALILDSGTGYVKIGMATDTFPHSAYPALVGRPILRSQKKYNDVEIKPIMVGHEAAAVRNCLELSYPMQTGIIKNWEDQNLVWQYGFDMMKIDPKETRVLLTEPVKNPTESREAMCQHIFETHGFAKMSLQVQALLSALGEGLTSTTVVDSGDGVTHVIPILDGYIIDHLIKRVNLAGKFITERLSHLLFLKGMIWKLKKS